MKPRLLDLFCGAGGAAMGYHRAGFDVVGVDINPQPHYPFEFHQGDAMTWPLDGFDAIHASPPCQDHSELATHFDRVDHGTGWMLAATIERLRAHGKPFVVENVPGARDVMPDAFVLCGRSFGLGRLIRHRRFVVAPTLILAPPCCCDGTPAIGVYGELSKNDRATRKNGTTWRAGIQTARDLMDCQWMDGPELSQAIPPAYTEHIGAQLLAACTPDEVDEVQPDDLAYDAWVLLANGGYWDHTDPKGIEEWDAARIRWRDRWHATLPTLTPDEVDEVQA